MIASSSAGSYSTIRERDTAACNGFIDDRANRTRAGSPVDATNLPSVSHTAT
jgi:hypothetical protein